MIRAATTVALLCVASLAGCADDKASQTPPGNGEASVGKTIAEQAGCMSCHSVDGSKKTGPSWQGVAGSNVKLKDGSTVLADAAYLEESIRDPNAKVVAGFSAIMPTVSLTDGQVRSLVAYLESIGTRPSK